MKLGSLPDNLAERIALWTGIIPPGVFESWFGIMLSRTIMVATRLDVFEALAAGPLTSAEVAVRCHTHPAATEKLLNALVSVQCLRARKEKYALRKSLREWVLKDGKHSFRGQILLHFLEWRWWKHCEEYVRTGCRLGGYKLMFFGAQLVPLSAAELAAKYGTFECYRACVCRTVACLEAQGLYDPRVESACATAERARGLFSTASPGAPQSERQTVLTDDN